MAQYPIKMLKDENGTPFVPLVAPEAVKDSQGTDLQSILDTKLEKGNIIAGSNITLSVSGNNITINSTAGGATTNIIDNLNQSTGGVGVLDAHQGYVLKGMIPGVQNNLTSTSTTDALSAYQGYLLSNRVVPGGGATGQVLKKKSGADNDLEWGDAASAVGDALPIGTLSPFVGLVAPKGYLICMGQLVDKAKYPELWELCGDTFGPSTATQFYLPDLRGQVIAGYKQGDATFGTLGALIGGKTTSYTPAGTNSGGAVGNHTLTAAESGMPTHKHNIVNSDVMIWSGTWGIQGNQGFTSGTQSIGSVGAKALGKYVTTDDITGISASSAHNHGFTNPTFTGTEADINVVQPTAVFNWIIKASMIAVIESNIEDSLTSTSATDALSARQGKALNDKFGSMSTYSTTETNTGKIWIDGKPIYRKVYTYTKNADTDWQSVSFSSIGITNYDYIYFADGSRYLQQDIYVKDIGNDVNIYIDTSRNTLNFAPTTIKMVFTLVFEYTKTTD